MTNLHLFPGGGTAASLPIDADDHRHRRELRLRHPAQLRRRQLCPDPGDAQPDGHGSAAMLSDHGGRRGADGARPRASGTSRSAKIDLEIVLGLTHRRHSRGLRRRLHRQDMPLEVLRWMVIVVVLYAATSCFGPRCIGRREHEHCLRPEPSPADPLRPTQRNRSARRIIVRGRELGD